MQNDISELKDQLKSKEIENSKLRKEMEKYKTELKALEERLNDADKVFRGSKAFENKTYDASVYIYSYIYRTQEERTQKYLRRDLPIE